MTRCDLERSLNYLLWDPINDQFSTVSWVEQCLCGNLLVLMGNLLLWSGAGQQMLRQVVILNSVLSLWMAEHLQQRQPQSGFLSQHFPFFSATCVTPAPFWNILTAALLQTVHRPQERASGIGPRQMSTDRPILMKWWKRLSVNPDEMFLSGKNLRSESFQTGRRTRPREVAASWPRTEFRKFFSPMIQTPLRSKSKPDTMPFSSSPPQCGLHWSHYSPSVLWVTNRNPPQIFHECHTTFVVFLSRFDSLFFAARAFFIFLNSWRISLAICLLIIACVCFGLASYFPLFPEYVWLQ